MGYLLALVGLGYVSTNLMRAYCLCSGVGEARRLFDRMPEVNLVSWNVMLNGYAKAGLVDMARELFERVPDKDVISWGTMIDGYILMNRLHEALVMYRAMLRSGLALNEILVVNLVTVKQMWTFYLRGFTYDFIE